MKDILTQKELQEVLKRQAMTIWRWKKKGMPVMKGNLYYLPDVLAWMRGNDKRAE